MKLQGLQKALAEFDAARRARAAMAAASRIEEVEAHWAEFLVRFGRIYNKLAAATKGDPRAAPWFGRQSNLRSKDPLLRYLHQARDCHEHSIEAVTETHKGSATFASDDGGKAESLQADMDGFRGRIFLRPGTSGTIGGSLPGIVLVPVTNRGVTYDPPAQYGNSSGHQIPIAAADAALTIANAMLLEARDYLQF